MASSTKNRTTKKIVEPSRNQRAFLRASHYWERGDVSQAFEGFLALANDGDVGAQLNVGLFFDHGISVARDWKKALHWYRRAYAEGSASGANNIGTVLLDRGDVTGGVRWFSRALRMGNDGSALEIAKAYSRLRKYPSRVVELLKLVSSSNRVCEADREEAARMLAKLDLEKSTTSTRKPSTVRRKRNRMA